MLIFRHVPQWYAEAKILSKEDVINNWWDSLSEEEQGKHIKKAFQKISSKALDKPSVDSV